MSDFGSGTPAIAEFWTPEKKEEMNSLSFSAMLSLFSRRSSNSEPSIGVHSGKVKN